MAGESRPCVLQFEYISQQRLEMFALRNEGVDSIEIVLAGWFALWTEERCRYIRALTSWHGMSSHGSLQMC